jgi:ABC-type lipoprotein export system ATPase subunit
MTQNEISPISRQKVAEVKNLIKTYGAKGFQTKVLMGIDLTIYKNDFIAIMGPSGSGKTTLLNILSTIDKPTQGTVMLDNEDITRASIRELSRLRRDKIGFVFQDYNLLDTMTLQDNIALPLSLTGKGLCGKDRTDGGKIRAEGAFAEISLPAVGRSEAAGGGLPGPDHGAGDHFRR